MHLWAQTRKELLNKPLTQRIEAKYPVNEVVADAVNSFIQPYVKPDPLAIEGASYPVYSLYFDTPDFRFLRDTCEGVKNRFKLRLRHYGPECRRIFFEIKRRLGDVVYKQRASLTRETAISFLDGKFSGDCIEKSSLDVTPDESYNLFEFRRYMEALKAEPRLLVKYSREAYIGRNDESLRVTFDRDIQFLPLDNSGDFINGIETDSLPYQDMPVILEVKFTDSHPVWVSKMFQRFDLVRRSFSKYRHGMEQMEPWQWNEYEEAEEA